MAAATAARDNLPWTEKYRPRTLDQVQFQQETVATLRTSLDTGNLPHLLFYGPPGTVKTTTILALARQMYTADAASPQAARERLREYVLELNASDERGIGAVRGRVKEFAQMAPAHASESVSSPGGPSSQQIPFFKSTAKFKALVTGVGFGKTACLVLEALYDALSHPNTLILIFAPTFPMLKNVTMREFFKWCPREFIAEHNTSNHIVKLINGTEIIYLSGDDLRSIERIRGLTLGSVYLDEAALSPKLVWDIVLARVRDARGSLKIMVKPVMKWSSDLKNRAIIISLTTGSM